MPKSKAHRQAKSDGARAAIYDTLENPTTKVAAAIPPMDKTQSLTQFMTEYLCRVLEVDGLPGTSQGCCHQSGRRAQAKKPKLGHGVTAAASKSA
jgi:hypothetical protein